MSDYNLFPKYYSHTNLQQMGAKARDTLYPETESKHQPLVITKYVRPLIRKIHIIYNTFKWSNLNTCFKKFNRRTWGWKLKYPFHKPLKKWRHCFYLCSVRVTFKNGFSFFQKGNQPLQMPKVQAIYIVSSISSSFFKQKSSKPFSTSKAS